MYKPNGDAAINTDPLLLIHLWSQHLVQKNSLLKTKMIFAGIGKPSYALNEDIINEEIEYWSAHKKSQERMKVSLSNKCTSSDEEWCETIVNEATPIGYGLPAGEQMPKAMMAQALSSWYQISIAPEDIIFTVGGWIALQMLFRIVNRQWPQGRIVTPFPFYTFYNNTSHGNNLHFIDLLSEPGYRLSAKALQKSLEDANRLSRSDGKKISAFLFCDPHNPLGTTTGEDEWKKIARILETEAPDVPIILDEAYAEMTFNRKHVSLLQAAPWLKNRIIVLRSATKSLSASGERMTVMACFNPTWREFILDEILLSYLHVPKSLQRGYSKALLNFSEEKRIDLTRFYQIQSEYVQNRLRKMNALLPDPTYRVEGTFYVIANLSDLLGTAIPDEASRALGKTGMMSTDEDICYSLLFRDHIMISALSFFGLDPTLGYVRITCSGGLRDLKELMDRIETRLNEARSAPSFQNRGTSIENGELRTHVIALC